MALPTAVHASKEDKLAKKGYEKKLVPIVQCLTDKGYPRFSIAYQFNDEYPVLRENAKTIWSPESKVRTNHSAYKLYDATHNTIQTWQGGQRKTLISERPMYMLGKRPEG